MLILYALARPLLAGTNTSESSLASMADDSSVTCDDIHGCRTVPGIIWSCLSVVFICTWVAIHPNVPTPHHNNTVTVTLQNAGIMVMALIAPELIVLWAMRQWFSARKIIKQFKKYRLSKTHAFFILMGGFALYERDEYSHILWANDSWHDEDYKAIQHIHGIKRNNESEESKPGETGPENGTDATIEEHASSLNKSEESEPGKMELENGRDTITEEYASLLNKPEESRSGKTGLENRTDAITKEYACPLEYLLYHCHISITEEEIQDRSHADVLSKTIAIVQTTWFILQCIARGAQGLAITELEIITLAFAFLNFITYFLWWNKPLRVRYPVRVTWRIDEDLPPHAEELQTTLTSWVKAKIAGIRRYIISSFHRLWRNQSYADEPRATLTSWMSTVKAKIIGIRRYIVSSLHKASFHGAWKKGRVMLQILLVLALLPTIPFLAGFQSIMEGKDNSLFSSRLDSDPIELYAAVYLIAVAFGALHCIAWSFNFPTEAEQLQWWIMSILVAVLPLSAGPIHVMGRYKDKVDEFINSLSKWPGFLVIMKDILVGTSGLILGILYTMARIWLIVLALMALRDLPPSAYQAVQWLNFIPHIG
ncbi:hypothetical protein Moror_3460 [Moniliophthora roreri MCA 2997]|uniref:Uncharacterized protein n=2 Tax=Moniliophthora roreri TaxID=221103 RepID=V2WZ38_MONRO|nr:hypothetical protein Moror_3460 [Moniliophthora roreri MCA 2997]